MTAYEIRVRIGPCSDEACTDAMEAVLAALEDKGLGAAVAASAVEEEIDA